MPIEQKEYAETNKDESSNNNYCVFYCKDGSFVQDVNLEEFIECVLQFASENGMSKEDFKNHCDAMLPTLKRWANK